MVRTGSLQRVGHSEVGHAGVASGEQDILGFDVAVHNAVLVCAIQGFSDFPGDPNCVLDWQLTFPPQPIPQALAFDVRHGVPQALASFTGVEHGQDVRVVEPGREADFPEEPLWAERSAELGMKRLIAFRDSGNEQRFFDIYFAPFQKDPFPTVEKLYEFLGEEFTPEARARMMAWREGTPRDKHGRHEYDGADYGLDTAALRQRFRFYSDRFDVPLGKD